jgi:endo-1,4-beta-xylanase
MTHTTALIVLSTLTLLLSALAVPARAQAEPKTTLRQAANGKFLVGAAVMSSALDDPATARLLAEQFDSLTAENEFKPSSLQPRQGEFNFAPADRIVAFAREHDMRVVGHTLVWHQQSPKWMFEDESGKPLGREAALKNLKDHIDAVAGHFKGGVVGWDVVNEALSDRDDEYLRDTPARRAIGDDYLARAFEFAAAADPDAELYYNDYSIEYPGKRAKTLRLLRELKEAGVRVDGVGIQGHWLLGSPDAKMIDDAIAAFGKEGVKVMVTELDVDVLPRRRPGGGADLGAREEGGADPYTDGLPDDVAQQQAQRYAEIFRVLRKHDDLVTRVTFWGVHDGRTWLNNWPVRGRTNHPLLWDRDLRAKPALEAVLKALE